MRPARPRGFVNHALTGVMYGTMLWPALAALIAGQHWASATPAQHVGLVALGVAGEVTFALLGGVLCEAVLLLLGLALLCKVGVGHAAAWLGLDGVSLGMAQLAAAFGVPGALVAVPMVIGLVVERVRGY